MEPELIFFVIILSVAGAALGTFTGLVPGIHVNTLAALMISSYALLETFLSGFFPADHVPILVASCIVSAAVVHSFVDFVPSVFLGAPDPDDVMNILPGHRLLLEGTGMIAVRAAAIGSLVGSLAAIALAVPLQFVINIGFGDYLESITLVVLLVVVLVLIVKEKREKMMWAAVLILLSGILGIISMNVVPTGSIISDGTLLFPLLTGLFGIPAMIVSMNNGKIPEQTDDIVYPVDAGPGLRGTLTGGIVGWFPGVTATSGAVIGTTVLPEEGSEKFISLVGSIGSAATIFALVTLSMTGNGRTGTMLAVNEVLGGTISGVGNNIFMLMLLSVAVASFFGYFVTIRSGKIMSKLIMNKDLNKLNRAIVVSMIILVFLMTGVFGLFILLAASVLGLVPTAANVSRVHLSGCLIVPVVMMRLGIDTILLGFI